MATTIKLLQRIWKERIEREYRDGWIPYERTLQAAIFHHLRAADEPGLQVFAEVQAFLDSGNPDLVIARGNRVEAVLELKLQLGGIRYQLDCKKLARWATRAASPTQCHLQLDPSTLTLRQQPFLVTPATQWIFAAIGQDGYDHFNRDLLTKCVGSIHRDKPRANFWLFSGKVGSIEPATFNYEPF